MASPSIEIVTVAQEVAGAAGLPTEPWWPPKGFGLPSAVVFLGDQNHLVAFVPPGAGRTAGDQALAYAIAHAGNRRVALLMTEPLARTARLRASVLANVDVHTITGEAGHYEVAGPAAADDADRTVVIPATGLAPGLLHLSAEQEGWIAPLHEMEVYPYLVPAGRKSYRAWHSMGRQLLKVQKGATGLLVTAGVDYSKPTGEQLPAVTVELTGPLAGEDFEQVKRAVYRGMIDRFEGQDKDKHLEHRMQSVLKGHPECFIPEPSSLLEREFPALRPTGRLAFLDFLYVGVDDRLHIVETKIGDDELLIVQGLDYWLWATTNLDWLRRYFKAPSISGVVVDYVVATRADLSVTEQPSPILLSSYAPAQMSRIAGVDHAVYWCQGWKQDKPMMRHLSLEQISAQHVKQTTMHGPHWV